ncbi:hypothetical protein HZA97_06515 [Candidatus Woesearchaeota archaeon]|nr:hypothetical protein [Candidatus Woesearchaeota archaeon]
MECTTCQKQSNSERGLEMLCQQQPDHPISHGLGKLAKSIGCGALAVGSAWFLSVANENRGPFYIDNVELVMVWAANLSIGGIGIASGLYGLYSLADSFTSLAKPFRMYQNDGTVYYRNGGFTNTPSSGDKKFGTRVVPIDNADDLTQVGKEKVFLNGFVVENTNMTSEKKDDGTARLTSSYMEYTTIVRGNLNGKQTTIYAVTHNNYDFAKKLADQTKGIQLFVVGEVRQNKENTQIDLEQYGQAF